MEFSVKYDERSLSNAALRLFIHRWRPLFPWPTIGLATFSLLAGAVCLYLRGPIEITIVFLSLCVVDIIGLPALFTWYRARIMRRTGEVARVSIEDHFVHVESPKGVGKIPWKDIAEIEIGPVNVLLYVGRGVAIILPMASIPSNVIGIIEEKRLAKTTKP